MNEFHYCAAFKTQIVPNNYFSTLKSVCIILLLYVSVAYGQADSIRRNDNVCDYLPSFLARYGTVVYGSVTKIEEDRFKVHIHESMKGRKRNFLRRNLIVQFPKHSYTGHLGNADYQLEIGQQYIFALGSTRWRLHSLTLRWSCNRFIVQNDSLFIPTEVLEGVSLPENVNIHQKNTFNDPIFSSGYISSMADFRELCKVLNECFIRTRNRHVFKTEKSVEHFSDPFIEALVRHLEVRVPYKTR